MYELTLRWELNYHSLHMGDPQLNMRDFINREINYVWRSEHRSTRFIGCCCLQEICKFCLELMLCSRKYLGTGREQSHVSQMSYRVNRSKYYTTFFCENNIPFAFLSFRDSEIKWKCPTEIFLWNLLFDSFRRILSCETMWVLFQKKMFLGA